MSTTKIQIANSEKEIARCFEVVAQLRPHIKDKHELMERVKRQQSEGYYLAYAEDGGVVHAVAGFRIFEMLSRGRFMYVDDLVTNENSRSAGYGKALFEWLVRYAKAEKCERLNLDSGVHRFRAHRFYFREGMHIQAYHFSREFLDPK
ncbi:GNAT family N-acetyltransferase [Candidatus Acetothermia bacterium]|nr:GNAT family N-acetyltransferase [Candidatus Acetothermia bacterium]MBI3644127.1 GNAT family N-acetyltransferase [Candidatus Acetothermia bacterium]